MKPLLNIRSVPITIEHKVTRGELRPASGTSQPKVNVTRQRGGMAINRTPAQVSIDTTEARASVGLKSTRRSLEEYAADGRASLRDAAARFTDEGQQILESHGQGSPIAEIEAAKISKPPAESQLTFVPSTGPDISVDTGGISFQYSMDRLTFDWNLNQKPMLEYVPADIEFVVTQYPEVIIEYVGDPIYVPPSADPNYVPPPNIDVKG